MDTFTIRSEPKYVPLEVGDNDDDDDAAAASKRNSRSKRLVGVNLKTFAAFSVLFLIGIVWIGRRSPPRSAEEKKAIRFPIADDGTSYSTVIHALHC